MAFEWGQVVYEAYSTLGPRHQNCFQIVLVYQGRMRILLNEETVLLGEGEGIWLVPGVDEFYEMGLSGQLRHAWIHADPEVFPKNPGIRVAAKERTFVSEPPLDRLMKYLLEASIHRVEEAQSFHGMLASACCWWVLEKLGWTDLAHPQQHPSLRRALEYIRKHFSGPIDLVSLAREARISPQQLTRLFHEAFSCTPIRYLWQFRDEQALRLIRDSGLRFSEIADRCGYSNPYHFTRRMTRHFGKSPKALREAFWKTG